MEFRTEFNDSGNHLKPNTVFYIQKKSLFKYAIVYFIRHLYGRHYSNNNTTYASLHAYMHASMRIENFVYQCSCGIFPPRKTFSGSLEPPDVVWYDFG